MKQNVIQFLFFSSSISLPQKATWL